MADLDSRQKRESCIGYGLGFARVQPTPDGSDADSEDERAHLVFVYGGISAAVVPPTISHYYYNHRMFG